MAPSEDKYHRGMAPASRDMMPWNQAGWCLPVSSDILVARRVENPFPEDIVFIDRSLSGHLGNLARLRAAGPWGEIVHRYASRFRDESQSKHPSSRQR